MADLDAPEDQGLGYTQIHDGLIECEVVSAPVRGPTDDEFQLASIETAEEIKKIEKENISLEDLTNNEDQLEDDFIRKIRMARLNEMKAKAEEQKKIVDANRIFPEMDIDEFEEKIRIPSKDGFILMAIIKPGDTDSDILYNSLKSVGVKYPSIKLFWTRASDRISNFPLSHTPALLVYRNQKVFKQFATLTPFASKQTNADVVEWELNNLGVLSSSLKQDPRESMSLDSINKINISRNHQFKNNENLKKSAIRKNGKYFDSEDSDSDHDDRQNQKTKSSHPVTVQTSAKTSHHFSDDDDDLSD